MSNSIKALLVSFLLTGAACGGGSGGDDLARFTGVWAPTAGTQILNCGGQSNPPTQVSGTITWSLGTSSDLIQTSSSTSCVIHADAEGDTATATGNQPCTAQGTDDYGESLTNTTTITAYTFVLAADGRTATENASGTFTQTNNTTGGTVSCTLTETGGSYQKQ